MPRLLLLALVVGIVVAGCTGSPAPPPSTPAVSPAPSPSPAPSATPSPTPTPSPEPSPTSAQTVWTGSPAPIWDVGDAWVYEVRTAAGTQNVSFTVVATNDSVGGIPVYTTLEQPVRRVAFHRQSDLNEVRTDGTIGATFSFPMREDDTWLATEGAARGPAHVEWVPQVVTPVATLGAFKITTSFADVGVTKVAYFAPEAKNLVRLETYEQGRLASLALLTGATLERQGAAYLPPEEPPRAGFAAIPRWRPGDVWQYATQLPAGEPGSSTLVVADNASVGEGLAYVVQHEPGERTSLVLRSTLNTLVTTNSTTATYAFPLYPGATWRVDEDSIARADWVTQVVTAFGELDAFQITVTGPEGIGEEVYHYAPSLKNIVRVELYEGGVLTRLATLSGASISA